MRQAFIGVGANLGDRAAALTRAIARLRACPEVGTLEVSSVYETKPVGMVNQPIFLNMVAGIETTLSPERLLHTLQEIETAFGRSRDVRWGPRTVDLDLLLFEGENRATAELQLPHPRMFERTFVTIPLAELLKRPRFEQPCWTTVREQLGPVKIGGGVELFSENTSVSAPDSHR
jgi:2-amino-4-hydroxy-6-hydroxymethyldihydropteridine diphosphokinase